MSLTVTTCEKAATKERFDELFTGISLTFSAVNQLIVTEGQNYLNWTFLCEKLSTRWSNQASKIFPRSPLISELIFPFFPGLRWFPGSAWPYRNLHAWQDSNTENLTHSDLQSSLVAESSWECCHGLVSGTVWDRNLFALILFLNTSVLKTKKSNSILTHNGAVGINKITSTVMSNTCEMFVASLTRRFMERCTRARALPIILLQLRFRLLVTIRSLGQASSRNPLWYCYRETRPRFLLGHRTCKNGASLKSATCVNWLNSNYLTPIQV